MFALRYTGEDVFTLIKGCKYFRKKWFAEQDGDGTYIRDDNFFAQNRLALVNRKDIALNGIRKEFEVCYNGDVEAVKVGDRLFRRNVWETLPIDFNSRDAHGNDMFNTLKFIIRSISVTTSDLNFIADGQNILVLRKYGGLGDIIMQSMIFPDLRKRFPKSEITFAIPKRFHPLFKGCSDIDKVIDSDKVVEGMYRLLATGAYAFIGDISTSCARYEVESIGRRGYVDKERPDIWAESMGLKLTDHRTCINLRSDEIEKARKYLNLESDSRKIIGIVPFSGAMHRAYPHTQEVIDGLVVLGHRVIVTHSEPLIFENCEKLEGPDLRFLGGIIKNLDAVIAVDTGPMHYAGILGIPVVALFGVTDSKVRLSYYKATAIQGKCDKQEHPCWHGSKSETCVKGNTGIASCMFIDPAEVIKATEEILNA